MRDPGKPAAVGVLIDGNIVGFLDIWSAVLSLSAVGTAGTSASGSR